MSLGADGHSTRRDAGECGQTPLRPHSPVAIDKRLSGLIAVDHLASIERFVDLIRRCGAKGVEGRLRLCGRIVRLAVTIEPGTGHPGDMHVWTGAVPRAARVSQ